MTKAQRQMVKEYSEKKFSTLKLKKELKLRVDIGTTSAASIMFFLDEKTDDPRYVKGWKSAWNPAFIRSGHRRSDVLLRDYCDQILENIEKIFGAN